MSNETKWAWEGGDRFSIGGRCWYSICSAHHAEPGCPRCAVGAYAPETKRPKRKIKAPNAYLLRLTRELETR